MTNHDAQRTLYAAVVLHGTLFLIGLFVAGIIFNSTPAWLAALAGMGIAYLAEIFQTYNAAGPWSQATVVLSILVPLAGFVILAGHVLLT